MAQTNLMCFIFIYFFEDLTQPMCLAFCDGAVAKMVDEIARPYFIFSRGL